MTHYDVLVIGTGSGNSIIDDSFSDQRVALAEKGLFGGTCLNVGCIPTKMFVHPADIAREASESAHLNITASYSGYDFEGLKERIFGRIDAIEADGRAYRTERMDNVTVFAEAIRFVGPKEFETASGQRLSAERIVIAAGSHPTPLEVPGLDWSAVDTPGFPVVTSDTVMRLDNRPESMVIVGSGFIAAEFAHIFSSLGTDVTVLVRGGSMLAAQDEEISRVFTREFSSRVKVRFGVEPAEFAVDSTGVRIAVRATGRSAHTGLSALRADTVLVAVGRTRSSAGLNPQAAEIDLDGDRIVVDEHQRVLSGSKPIAGMYALGDISSPHLLKHVANREARVVRANLLAELSSAGELRTTDHRAVPAAVFSYPQVASVGETERQLRDRGADYVSHVHPYSAVAFGWALDDSSSIVKVLADARTHRLLGAHIVGPQASTLIQTFIHAMSFEQTVEDVATGQYWIHPALTEVVENALLGLSFPS